MVRLLCGLWLEDKVQKLAEPKPCAWRNPSLGLGDSRFPYCHGDHLPFGKLALQSRRSSAKLHCTKASLHFLAISHNRIAKRQQKQKDKNFPVSVPRQVLPFVVKGAYSAGKSALLLPGLEIQSDQFIGKRFPTYLSKDRCWCPYSTILEWAFLR